MDEDDGFFEAEHSMGTHDHHRLSALDVGTAIAAAGLAFDLAPLRVQGAISPGLDDPDDDEDKSYANAAGHQTDYVKDWDSYVGQAPMKEQLQVHIQASKQSWAPLDHVLLASGQPGAGKTTLARLIAKEYNTKMTMLVPPFGPETLHRAAMDLDDYDFLFIDEIHKMADSGKRQAENLLHLLEERTLYLKNGPVRLAAFTVIGATTDVDKLPETIIDRFPIKPYFQKYSDREMIRIVRNFLQFYGFDLLPEVVVAIAKASRSTPRVAREFVVAARDMQITHNRFVTPEELLAFKQVEPDGLTKQHMAYLLTMYQYFGRMNKGGREYVAGEATMMSSLRETKQGIQRIERFLTEKGFLDRTPSGRKLTPSGIARAKQLSS